MKLSKNENILKKLAQINIVDRSEMYKITEDTSKYRKAWRVFLSKLTADNDVNNYIKDVNKLASNVIFDVLANTTKFNSKSVRSLKLF